MKPSSFPTMIENHFDYICKQAMEDERKDYFNEYGCVKPAGVRFP